MVKQRLGRLESGVILPYTHSTPSCARTKSPSFVITLSWHTSVKKVTLPTPNSLTSAQQTLQSALCAAASCGDGFVDDEPACCPGPLRSGDPHSRQSQSRSPCSPLAEQPGGRQRPRRCFTYLWGPPIRHPRGRCRSHGGRADQQKGPLTRKKKVLLNRRGFHKFGSYFIMRIICDICDRGACHVFTPVNLILQLSPPLAP